MRCGRCRKEISGIGKPAVPPVVPAAVAFAGSIWGLFSLTLGQDPANALPNWSPVTGWAAGLGSLGLASVLVWIGLARRKCPECGATQMLDAMEEEAQNATERMAAVNSAVAAARVEWGNPQTVDRTPELRAQIEAEVRAAQARENTDRLALLERDLRAQFEVKLRAELERQQHARPVVVTPTAAPPVAPDPAADMATPPPVVVARPVAAAPAGAAARPVTPAPVNPARTITASPAPATRSVTPGPVSPAKTLVASPAPATKPVTPAPVSPARTLVASPAPAARPVTPAPVSITAAIAAAAHSQAAASSPAAAPKAASPGPSPIPKTSLPAAPHSQVDTAPLALMVSVIPPAAHAPGVVGSSPATSLASQTSAVDVHERAKRRARVILSDLLAYHRDELVKAARAADPRQELGPLWRDAIVSYNEAAAPEIRGVSNYLEEELSRQLAELRRT
jgi:hypothetical protein